MTLENRYGSQKKNRLNKIVGVSAAAAMLLIGILFLATGGMPTNDKEIDFRDIGMLIKSDEEVDISYEVTTRSTRDIACALDALSPSYSTVGLKIVEIPASEKHVRLFEDSVKTSYRATSVTVRHCWFTN